MNYFISNIQSGTKMPSKRKMRKSGIIMDYLKVWKGSVEEYKPDERV